MKTMIQSKLEGKKKREWPKTDRDYMCIWGQYKRKNAAFFQIKQKGRKEIFKV